ncbi:MAG: prepilin-type N-terminal cleavage/methylation domain-containing protein [Candidatus Hydrogenedentota bacterium]|nr:MAG: prepilin-type N-terminal cleavage/methylation domain-containing protein [Candidatus Hydrogenedentota bacterium]
MKKSRKKRLSSGGFTLIEILVATAILAIIFSIIFGTFFYTINNAEEQQERAAIYHRASFILNNISQNVSSAYVPFGGNYRGDENEKSVFLGSDVSLEDSDMDSLSTFTTNPRFGTRGIVEGTAYVSYEVASGGGIGEADWLRDDNNPLLLKCALEHLQLKSEDEDAERVQWTQNIRSLNIEYFDGSDWIQEWSYEDQGALPNAVKAELELADSNGESYAFSTIAHVHVNTLLEEPAEETEEAEETGEIEEPQEGEELDAALAGPDEPFEAPDDDEPFDF